ncbi:MFS transporter [Pseudonocardia sichuanensis]
MGRWSLVVAAGLVIFMAQLDATIVMVALPTIQRSLGVVPAAAEWVVLGYLVPLIGLSLTGGRWVDLVGQRSALAVGSIGFALAGAAAGAASEITMLIAARAVQGAFGALLLALAPVLAVSAIGEAARSRALAVVSVLAPLGAMSGPAAGGVLVETLGWPWIFYINVPVAVVVVAIGWAGLPAGHGFRLPPPGWVGEAATFGGAAVAVLLGLTFAVSEHPAWLAMALVAVPLLALWRRSATSRPVRSLLAVRSMVGIHLALATAYTSVLLVLFLAPFHLQNALGASAAVTGAVMLAHPAAAAAAAPLSGLLADRRGPRLPALAGVTLVVVGLGLLVPLGGGWQPIDLAWRLAIVGLGFGLFVTPVQARAFSIAPPDLLATASASTNLARHVGLALGPAVGTAAWAMGGYTVAGMRAGIAAACVLGVLTVLAVAQVAPPRSCGAGPLERRELGWH